MDDVVRTENRAEAVLEALRELHKLEDGLMNGDVQGFAVAVVKKETIELLAYEGEASPENLLAAIDLLAEDYANDTPAPTPGFLDQVDGLVADIGENLRRMGAALKPRTPTPGTKAS